MARLLALMGASRLGAGLADLATAARLGTIEMTPGLELHIQAACADVREIRALLLRALGLSAGAGR